MLVLEYGNQESAYSLARANLPWPHPLCQQTVCSLATTLTRALVCELAPPSASRVSLHTPNRELIAPPVARVLAAHPRRSSGSNQNSININHPVLGSLIKWFVGPAGLSHVDAS